MNRILLYLLFVSFEINAQNLYKSDDIYMQIIEKSFENKGTDTVLILYQEYLPTNIPNIINEHKIKVISKEDFGNYNGRAIALKEFHSISVDNEFLNVCVGEWVFNEEEKIWDYVGYNDFRFKFICTSLKFEFLQKVFIGF